MPWWEANMSKDYLNDKNFQTSVALNSFVHARNGTMPAVLSLLIDNVRAHPELTDEQLIKEVFQGWEFKDSNIKPTWYE